MLYLAQRNWYNVKVTKREKRRTPHKRKTPGKSLTGVLPRFKGAII